MTTGCVTSGARPPPGTPSRAGAGEAGAASPECGGVVTVATSDALTVVIVEVAPMRWSGDPAPPGTNTAGVSQLGARIRAPWFPFYARSIGCHYDDWGRAVGDATTPRLLGATASRHRAARVRECPGGHPRREAWDMSDGTQCAFRHSDM